MQDSNPWPLGSWAVKHSTNWANQPTGSPGGGYPGFQVIGMIEQGQKSKPKKSQGLQTNPPKIPGSKFNPRKIPYMPNFRAIKISRTQRQSQNSFVFILITEVSSGNYHKSSDCFEYPRKSVVKSSYPKKFLTKFSYPKKSQNKKFQTPKSPGSSLSLEIRIIPAGQRVVFELARYKLMTSYVEIISKWKSYTLSLSVPKSFERDETVRCYQQPILSKEVSS